MSRCFLPKGPAGETALVVQKITEQATTTLRFHIFFFPVFWSDLEINVPVLWLAPQELFFVLFKNYAPLSFSAEFMSLVFLISVRGSSCHMHPKESNKLAVKRSMKPYRLGWLNFHPKHVDMLPPVKDITCGEYKRSLTCIRCNPKEKPWDKPSGPQEDLRTNRSLFANLIMTHQDTGFITTWSSVKSACSVFLFLKNVPLLANRIGWPLPKW